jgi:hypothetical protein
MALIDNVSDYKERPCLLVIVTMQSIQKFAALTILLLEDDFSYTFFP